MTNKQNYTILNMCYEFDHFHSNYGAGVLLLLQLKQMQKFCMLLIKLVSIHNITLYICLGNIMNASNILDLTAL